MTCMLLWVSLFKMAASREDNFEDRDSDPDGTGMMKSLSLREDEIEKTYLSLLEHIANSNVPVKSQQLGESELTIVEKCEILRELFDQKPILFLERYHKVLHIDDVECFSHLSNIYEVSFYINEVKKRTDAKVSNVCRQNRRYEALKRLESDGTYFSDTEMRARDPLMFEHYVGQYLTDEERSRMKKEIDKSDLKFSTILSEFMDEADVKLLQEKQRDEEDMVEEEEDSDTEEESDMEEDDEDIPSMSNGQTSPESSQRRVKVIPEEEKELLRQEFRHHMQERFLKGNDEDFDYSTVDDNVEYDSIDIRGRDEEEKYFDEEEPCDVLGPSDSGSDERCRTGTSMNKDGDGMIER